MAQGFTVPDSDRITGGIDVVPLPGKPPAPQAKTVQDGFVIDPNTATATPVAGLPPSATDAAPGQDELDKEFAKEYTQWRLTGQSDATKALSQLSGAADALQKKNLTGPIIGSIPDFINAWINPEAVEQREAVEEVAQRNLRLILGGQFAMKEGEQLIARAYNPKLPESTNRKRVLRLMKQMGEAAAQKESAARYFEENGTLKGWQGKLWTISDFDPEAADNEGEAAAPDEVSDVQEPEFTPSTDGTRSEINPERKALADKLGGLISKGADFNTLMGLATRVDPAYRDDQLLRSSLQEALQFRDSRDGQEWLKRNKGKPYPISPEFYTTEIPLGFIEGGVNDAAQTDFGAFNARAANMISAGTLDEIAQATGGDPENVRRALDYAGREHPVAAILGDLTGGVLSALAAEAQLAKLGMAPGAIRGLLADAGYGAALGAGEADEGNRLEGAAIGAGAGAAGNVAGRGVTNFLGNVAKGVTSPAVRAVIDEQVPVTVGQAVGQSGRTGRIVKGIEDRVAGFPGVGDMVNARRAEGIDAMNTKAFDKALEPINGNVGGAVGEEAVVKAQDAVRDAFTQALSGKAAAVDRPFITQGAAAKRAIQDLPRVGGEVESSVDEVVSSYFSPDGTITGENMQALLRELGAIKRGYANDPLGNRVGKAVGMVESAVEGLFRRQAPDVMPKYDAAKQAFRRVSIIEDSVLRAKNKGGVFTPGQLGMADRANAKKFSGTHAAAAGKGEFHDFQRAMQDVLPNEIPDSGTAGRVATLAVPGALAASGGGIGYAAGDPQSGAGAGLTLAALLALAYTKHGQRAMVSALTKRNQAARTAGRKIKGASRLIGAAGGSQAALGTTRD